jgi:hypothetical protein
MQGMVTPTSSTSGAAGAGANTGMASTMDRLAEDLTFTLDRKAETEQGECACVAVRLVSLDCCPVIARFDDACSPGGRCGRVLGYWGFRVSESLCYRLWVGGVDFGFRN